MHSGESTSTPCSSGTLSDGSLFSCLFGVMGKQWDHRLRVGLCLQPVFLSCTKCLLKTHQALWERGQLTPLISSAGRDTVSPWTTCHPKWPSGHTEEAAVSHVSLRRSSSVLPKTLLTKASTWTEQNVQTLRPQVALSKASQSKTTYNRFLCTYTFSEGRRDK